MTHEFRSQSDCNDLTAPPLGEFPVRESNAPMVSRTYRLTSTLFLEHLAQLRLCWRPLSPVFRTEYPTTHPNRFRACRKRITPIDENRGRTSKPDSFCHLRRLDQLVFEGEFVSIETLEHVGEPPISQLPMRASVEVLNGDSHCPSGVIRVVSASLTSKASATDSSVVSGCSAIHPTPVSSETLDTLSTDVSTRRGVVSLEPLVPPRYVSRRQHCKRCT